MANMTCSTLFRRCFFALDSADTSRIVRHFAVFLKHSSIDEQSKRAMQNKVNRRPRLSAGTDLLTFGGTKRKKGKRHGDAAGGGSTRRQAGHQGHRAVAFRRPAAADP